MTSLVSQMAVALVAGGFGTALGTDIFGYQIRPSPDPLLMILPLSGRLPILTIDSATPRPSIQVYVVGSDLLAAETKANSIWTYFEARKNTVGQAIQPARSGPLYLGIMEDTRHKFVVEFDVFGN